MRICDFSYCEAVVLLELLDDRFLQLVRAAGGSIFGESRLDRLDARLLCVSGVSKSGSPTPKSTTSIPFAFMDLAFAAVARVGDGLMDCALFAIPVLMEYLFLMIDLHSQCSDNLDFLAY